jgi:hypothetical protein
LAEVDEEYLYFLENHMRPAISFTLIDNNPSRKY